MARTTKVITAAAAIMVLVFAAFALTPDVILKLIGIGLATAILVDATIVRMVLVPALMQLLGAQSWWTPKWIDRILPQENLLEHRHTISSTHHAETNATDEQRRVDAADNLAQLNPALIRPTTIATDAARIRDRRPCGFCTRQRCSAAHTRLPKVVKRVVCTEGLGTEDGHRASAPEPRSPAYGERR